MLFYYGEGDEQRSNVGNGDKQRKQMAWMVLIAAGVMESVWAIALG